MIKNEKYLKREEPTLRIVEPNVWEKCNQRLAEIPHGKPRFKKTHPLMGIVKCGNCGYNMTKEGNTLYCSSFRTRKSCSNDVSLDYNFLFKWLTSHLKKFVELNRDVLLKKVEKQLTGEDYDVEDKIKKLKDKLRNLYNLYSESPDEILKEEIKNVKEQIKKFESIRNSSQEQEIDLERILSRLDEILKKNPEEANYIFKHFLDKVEISSVNGVAHVRVVFKLSQPEISGIKSIAGAGFEPATSGL